MKAITKIYLSGLIALPGSFAISQDDTTEPVVQLEETTLFFESIDRDAIIDSFDFKDLEEMQVYSVEDLVRGLPGISISQGDDRWGSSGYNIRGLDEDRVAINVDGMPQGETLKYETGQAYGYFKGSRNGIDVEALKAVEIVKGADSLFSGSGALAGAVNFTTKDPSDFLTASQNDSYFGLKTGFASVNDEKMGSVTFANRTGNFESLVIYTRREAGEYENYDMDGLDTEGSAREIPDPQGITQDSLLVKLDYLASDTQTLGLVYSYYERNSVTDTQSYNGGWYTNRIGDDYSETNRVGLTYDITASTPLFDTLEASLNKQSTDFEANTYQHVEFNFGPTFRSDEDRRDVRSFNQDYTQFRVDLTKEFGGDSTYHTLRYGFEYLDKEYENTQIRHSNSNLNDLGWTVSNIGSLIPAAEAATYTVYVGDSIEFGSSSRLRVGARYDEIEYNAFSDENYSDDTGTLGKTNFDAVTWGIGYEQDLNENLTASIGLSAGFRAPTIEEMYRTSGDLDDWSTVANPDLDSETSRNLDLAISGTYAVGSFRLGYFDSSYDDFVDYLDVEGVNPNRPAEDPMDPNGYQLPANIGQVDINGFEFSSSLDLNTLFGFDGASYTASFRAAYTEGEDDSGDPLYSIQPYSMSLGFGYLSQDGSLGARLVSNYSSGKSESDAYRTEEDGTVVYPLFLSGSVTTFDLTVFYNVNENLSLTAGVYNLTDQEYYRWDSVRFIDLGDFRPGIGVSGDGIKRYSEPGRNAKVSLSYQF